MKKEYMAPSLTVLAFEMQEEVTGGELNTSVTFGEAIDEW